MYSSRNKKVKLQDVGEGYELFLTPENAQHIIDRAAHESHKVTLRQVMNLAYAAYYIPDKSYLKPEPHLRVMGLVKYANKFYQIIAYLTQVPSNRCILESCHVVNEDRLQRWCNTHTDLIKTVSDNDTRKKPGSASARPRTR